MADTPEHRLRAALEAAVRARTVPAAAVAIGVRDRCLARLAVDAADDGTDGIRPLPIGTLFDLASLTKVMATAPAVLSLVDRGQLGLDDPVVRHLPTFRGRGRDAVTIRHLLAHTSGLPASRRYYLSHDTAAGMWQAVLSEDLESAPGERVTYSDLGFLLLGRVVEAVTGVRLDAACAALVHRPLGLARTGYLPPPDGEPLATTTEPDGEPAPGLPHDRNARLAGGVAGHAGLFAPLGDVARYAAWWSGPDDGAVSPATRAAALRCQTAGRGGRRGWGWVARGDEDDFLPEGWPLSAAMHTGFTGTSIAVDPVSGWWAVLLTNAIHLGRNRAEVGALRTAVHRLALPLLQDGSPPAP